MGLAFVAGITKLRFCAIVFGANELSYTVKLSSLTWLSRVSLGYAPRDLLFSDVQQSKNIISMASLQDQGT